jgi:cystathionine gamma-synthase
VSFRIPADGNWLVGKILQKAGKEGQSCLLFSRPEAATACLAFATSPSRGDDKLSPGEISLRVFDINLRIYAVFFPAANTPVTQSFWTNSGTGISSRLAEESLKHLELLHEVSESDPAPKIKESPAHGQIRERIAGLLERAPAGPPRQAKVSPDDVYLFQTGMAAIYGVHTYLLSKHNASTVLFGFAFHSTIHVFEGFGPGFKLLGLGTAKEVDGLEIYLEAEKKEGRKIQAVWTEFPANPMLTSADLGRLRKLADKYHFLLIVDDTVGSFCNVDVLGVADIVVTSLTKSFSGYADVMGASAVLNPSSARYLELKRMFKERYYNDYYNADAEVLDQNNRDYMSRSKVLNKNAERLVEYLQSQAINPSSTVSKVYYPTVNPSRPNYEVRMRKKTEEFTPGYGCLFSVEFHSVEAAIVFYDNLNVHHGPHLGAHLTLAMPYVKGLYGKKLDWASNYGLKETQIRIAAGLEDTEILLETFKNALRAADAMRLKEPQNVLV